MDDTDLQLNFAEFCFDHFQHNDNTKDEQYKTPLGSKDNSPNGNESESIEVVETPSNTYRGPLQESTISSASTNNTDICVLDSHYANDDLQFLPDHEDVEDDDDVEGLGVKGLDDEFVESEEGDEVFLRALNVMDKHEDFTVLQKPSKTRRLCNCEESTEVLMLINSEYQEKRKPTYSGTDSDVEVLMSEEIIESDWSSANGLDENPQDSTILNESPDIIKVNVSSEEEEISSASCLQESCNGNSLKTQDSTDFDVSGEELVDGAGVDVKIDKYQNLNRIQLLQIIQKQELCIKALEDTVERYQKAQQRLFEHVDALRLELSEIRITPSKTSEQTKI